jgi:hypothetical protein
MRTRINRRQFVTLSAGAVVSALDVTSPRSSPVDLSRTLHSPHWKSYCSAGRVPFKSQAQRRKFAALLVEGKISNKTFEEWNRETGRKRLPERVKRKPKTAGRHR